MDDKFQYYSFITNFANESSINRENILRLETKIGLQKLKLLNSKVVSNIIKNGYETIDYKSYNSLFSRSYSTVPTDKLREMIDILPVDIVMYMTKIDKNYLLEIKKFKEKPIFNYPYLSMRDYFNNNLGLPNLPFEYQASNIINNLARKGYYHPLLIAENIFIYKTDIIINDELDFINLLSFGGVCIKSDYSPIILVYFMKLQLLFMSLTYFNDLYEEFEERMPEILNFVNNNVRIYIDDIYYKLYKKDPPNLWTDETLFELYNAGETSLYNNMTEISSTYEDSSLYEISSTNEESSRSLSYDDNRIEFKNGWYVIHNNFFGDEYINIEFNTQKLIPLIEAMDITYIEKIYVIIARNLKNITTNKVILNPIDNYAPIPDTCRCICVALQNGILTIRSKNNETIINYSSGTIILLKFVKSSIIATSNTLWFI